MRASQIMKPGLVVAMALCAAIIGIAVASSGHAAAQEQRKSTIVGAGLGALVGQAIGKDTGSTIAGAVVGGGIGHVVGGEKEKAKAAKAVPPAQPAPTSSKTNQKKSSPSDPAQPLYDGVWKVESISPKDRVPVFFSKVVTFRKSGPLQTLTTNPEGQVTLSEETYSVVGDTLVVNKPNYTVQMRFKVEGDQLIVSAEDFSGVLRRIRPE